jgi:hypothetical protein
MWDHRLVSTDNGGMVRYSVGSYGEPTTPASAGNNWPLRGSKMTLFEGGVHGVAFLSGGALPPALCRTVYHGLTHIVDFTATIATAAGTTFPDPIDGVDILAAALGKASAREAVPINIFDYGAKYTAIRWKNFKVIIWECVCPFGWLDGWLYDRSPFRYLTAAAWQIIVGGALAFKAFGNLDANRTNGWFANGSNPAVEGAPAGESESLYVFDLDADPTEHHDLSKERPDLVAEGRAQLKGFINGGYQPIQVNEPNPLGAYLFHNDTWAPFMDTVECVDAQQLHCGAVRGRGADGCFECVLLHQPVLEAAGCKELGSLSMWCAP